MRRTVSLAAALAAGIVFSSMAFAAETGSPPDISGVWVTFQTNNAKGESDIRGLPKLSEQGKKMVADFKSKYDLTNLEPGANCVPNGMPGEMFGGGSYPFEVIQQPKRITMLFEDERQVRRIYLDGRGHPKDFPHTRGGHSVGHWEGDTLVVDTALLDKWPIERWPHSEQAHIVERFSLKPRSALHITTSGFLGGDVGNIILVDELTMTDPVMYDGPQKVTVYARKLDQKETLEYDCTEGNWYSAVEATAKDK